MGVVVTVLACIVLTVTTVAFITVVNWPRGAAPRRQLGDTMELSPFERL